MKNATNGGEKATFQPSLRERLVAEAFANGNASEPNAARASFFGADGASAIFADSLDVGKGNEAFVEFSRQKKSALETAFEFYCDGRAALAGRWTTELFADETPLRPVGNWTTVCDDLDDDYSFLERVIDLSGGRRFSRRLFLARNEALFLIADTIFSSSAERRRVAGGEGPLLRYRSAIPVANGTSARQDSEAREVELTEEITGRGPIAFARIFPITAPEWRADKSGAEFEIENRGENGVALTTTAARRGTALFVATLIDGDSRRAARPCSWRALTVGESLRVASDDAAVGRKIQLGRERFVLYASTSPRPAIRSVLGRNLLSDFMFGKFFADRGVQPIVDVETLDE